MNLKFQIYLRKKGGLLPPRENEGELLSYDSENGGFVSWGAYVGGLLPIHHRVSCITSVTFILSHSLLILGSIVSCAYTN